MSKKYWPILYSELLHKMGHYSLDILIISDRTLIPSAQEVVTHFIYCYFFKCLLDIKIKKSQGTISKTSLILVEKVVLFSEIDPTFKTNTVCQKVLTLFYTVSYYIKWLKASWACSNIIRNVNTSWTCSKSMIFTEFNLNK